VTNMTIARQRLTKHISELYAVNKNRHPLLDNGFGHHGITSVSVTAGLCRGICMAGYNEIDTRSRDNRYVYYNIRTIGLSVPSSVRAQL
jgi:hypothetical protein